MDHKGRFLDQVVVREISAHPGLAHHGGWKFDGFFYGRDPVPDLFFSFQKNDPLVAYWCIDQQHRVIVPFDPCLDFHFPTPGGTNRADDQAGLRGIAPHFFFGSCYDFFGRLGNDLGSRNKKKKEDVLLQGRDVWP